MEFSKVVEAWGAVDGSNISVWQDLWLRDEGGLLHSPHQQDLEGLRVKDLLHPQTNELNPAVINMIFVPVQMSRVLNVPLYRDTQRDHRVWRYDRRGARSVMVTVTLWTTVSTHNI